ncbi:5-methylcytosine-specific restriction enzyme A [Butyrivibrio hungatei]|uniref:Putative HNH nuclease YajD n=1 Tax=Butyrivibrio hungatei TaxID=185008 RepID=A0A1G5BFM5_9FIRM|nr:HNH endonuclease signature motif containing protein [Butyrivibrio hungatei]SCX88926.1 5-methylcytosine-specific restriction enzyme A [Butyrivibrio hungatei]
MPRKALHPCSHPGCPNLCEGRYCDEHKKIHPNNDRKNAAERGYGSKWQKARKIFLSRPENFFCVRCKEDGVLTRATVVDHIKPHRGDQELFWDESNWQPLCKKHHDQKTWNNDKYPVCLL